MITYICNIFVHSSTEGHLGSFPTLAIVNDAINTGIKIIFQYPVFLFVCVCVCISRSGIAGLYTGSVLINHQSSVPHYILTVLQNCTEYTLPFLFTFFHSSQDPRIYRSFPGRIPVTHKPWPLESLLLFQSPVHTSIIIYDTTSPGRRLINGHIFFEVFSLWSL